MSEPEFIPPRISENATLATVLNMFYKRAIRDYPVLGIITGQIRTGKSRSVLLNINDYWYKVFLKIVPPKASINTDIKEFITNLKKANEYYLTMLDEAVDAIGKGKSNSAILKDLQEMWAVCGERKVPSLIVLDDIFELTPKVARRFATFWIHVEKRFDNKCMKCKNDFVGKFCPLCGSKRYREGNIIYRFYSKKRLINMLTVNETKTIKRIDSSNIVPNFRSTLREYKGELVEYYNKLKRQKTNSKMLEVEKKHGVNSYKVSSEDRNLNRRIIDMKYTKGMTVQEIADELDIDYWKVSSKIKKLSEVMDAT